MPSQSCYRGHRSYQRVQHRKASCWQYAGPETDDIHIRRPSEPSLTRFRSDNMTNTTTAAPLASTERTERLSLIREAFRLEWLTIGWMTAEAVVAITAGVAAGSLVLVAFGLDSVIELASAGVLMWRLSVELRHGQTFSERAERAASRIGGALLFLLAAYVTTAAVWRLWSGGGEEFSWSGFLVALIAIPAMSYLARRKIAIAEQIGSRALHADAVEAVTC